MSLLRAGSRLGPYEIVAPLGAGGMGEVYRARDPRMGRDVAIKVAQERFTDRFEREVRAVAALNHPNICQVYDVGPSYLVMELVDGHTLADRIGQGALTLEEALPIARQLADALDAAHERGIIHRDLKPANIKITPDGVVKVLDFGLAKIAGQPAAVGGREESTVAMGATSAGHIMGTAAYMAPEQARAQAVDKRVDVWAFGVVLYEMLTGRRLFYGESMSDILAAVLTKEPEWERIPQKAQRLLKSCLEKDPKRRLRDIGDAWRLLEEAPALARGAGRWWILAAAALAAVSILLGVELWRGRQPRETNTSGSALLDLDLGPDVTLGTSVGPSVILSPDGLRLVYVSLGSDGIRRLFTRRLDQPQASQLSGSEGASAPFLSPDGQWVGFFAQGRLKKIRVDGGEPISLCDAPQGRGGSWGEDGRIIAALDTLTVLSVVPSDGARPVPLTELSSGENTHRWPQILPGGGAVIFNSGMGSASFDEANIMAVTLADRRKKLLIEHGGMSPRYLDSGHLVYVKKGSLFAVRFDPARLEVLGPPVKLGEVSARNNFGAAQIDFSRNGTFVYRTGGTEGPRTIQWLDARGKTEALNVEPGEYVFPALSWDGGRLAVILNQAETSDLIVYDFGRSMKTRLTHATTAPKEASVVTEIAYPVWSPDGRFVVFKAGRNIFWTRADGSGAPEPLTNSTNSQLPLSFTPDGELLVFSELIPGAGAEIRVLPVDSRSGGLRSGPSRLYLKTSTADALAKISPDGRWLAYGDTEGGGYEVYVRAFPDPGDRVQISNAGGMMPRWSRNGHELFYRTEDQRIMVAGYTVNGGSFVAAKPRVWMEKRLANTGTAANNDLGPDGRFIVLLPALGHESRATQSHVMIALNFFDEVRRRVGN
jgi:serine/threonine-protein kinase